MSCKQSLTAHWPEYLMEGALLGLFMISACGFAAALDYADSPVHAMISSPFIRRMIFGIGMGLTAVLLIYSPWGQRSGAHMNPSLTLTFYRLGKVSAPDAFFYSLAQFGGGVLGVLGCVFAFGMIVGHPSVNYVATLPGSAGVFWAFIAEVLISFLLVSMVLRTSNHPRLSRCTPIFAGCMVALYITFEAPISGMSMNPARTFGSAFAGSVWTSLWLYFTAPPVGMLAAAELYVRQKGLHQVFCAKYHHHNDRRCIFRCNYGALVSTALLANRR